MTQKNAQKTKIVNDYGWFNCTHSTTRLITITHTHTVSYQDRLTLLCVFLFSCLGVLLRLFLHVFFVCLSFIAIGNLYMRLCSKMDKLSLREVFDTVKANYIKSTNTRVKMMDLLVANLALLTLVQTAYVVIGGSSFPFNSFMSGIFSTLGSLVLTVALRIQCTSNVKPERAFAEYLAAMAVLQIAVFNFLG